MRLADGLIQELEMEAATTRRLLDRLPDSELGWKPTPKSRTLGQLALHIATNPGGVTSLAAMNPAEVPSFDAMDQSPASKADILAALDKSVEQAKQTIGGWDDAALTQTWRLTTGGKDVMAVPRIAFLRSIGLNHWYHHRGQLSVYLRLLGVPLPSIYGPSADENPFARA
jgi:uncharacterized damage-inducible protein DinB